MKPGLIVTRITVVAGRRAKEALNMQRLQFLRPLQGLKPIDFAAFSGTTEVVPCYKTT
jgi:hypothetical protein